MILFISRKYPPVVGGMESFAFHLHQQFKEHHQVKSIILGKSQWHLIWFVPWIFLYGTYLVLTNKVSHVYVGDGVLTVIALYFQKVFNKNVTLTIHGLDVIFNKFGYQKMIKWLLPKVNRVVANSQATKQQALNRGLVASRCHVIAVGVEIPESFDKTKEQVKQNLVNIINYPVENRKILFTIGRLVERKGVAWFVEYVIPQLADDYLYLIAGDGEQKNKIKSLISQYSLQNKVIILGRIDDHLKKLIFLSADVFISPNITIQNDMEGFGIVNLEAGTYGVPVVATAVDGVKDAVQDGKTGKLVEEKNVSALIHAISEVQKIDSNDIKKTVVDEYSWLSIYKKYWKLMSE